MIKAIGVDLVENKRFASFIDNEVKLKRIFSAEEITLLQSFTNKERQLNYLASRFAAKEALVKAGFKFNFNQVSILNDELGAPFIKGPFVEEILITLSHEKNMSIAFVVVKKLQDK